MKLTLKILTLAGLAIMSACAKFPPNGGSQSTRLIFTMTVAGEIRNNYIYIVALRPSRAVNPNPADGPLPVVERPWGNGFVAGNVSHFVQYDVAQSSPYLIYKFDLVDQVNYVPDLTHWSELGVPVNTTDVPPGGKVIQFEILLSDLEPDPTVEAALQTLQVNFLTMNRRPTGDDPGTKIWDALGNNTPSQVNDYINIPLTQNGVYNNDNNVQGVIEPEGDTPDPDLDITDWRVEVRRP